MSLGRFRDLPSEAAMQKGRDLGMARARNSKVPDLCHWLYMLHGPVLASCTAHTLHGQASLALPQ
jgi:hypothetical protein